MVKAKEIAGLECGASAKEGIRLVLRSRLEDMCALRALALDWSDPIGVHDMRVASRRLRSAVRDFSPYLRQRKLHHIKEDLKGLADALGAVRDQDVAILALEKLMMDAPPELAAGFERFANERRVELDIARAELEEVLTEEALAELQEEFNSALEHGLKVPRKRKGHNEDKGKSVESGSFRRIGREIILALFDELQGLSKSLYSPLKTKPLHRMRIAAKRLRYALELFAPCWGEPLKSLAKEIARLQTSLGELHDCDEWIIYLGAALRNRGGDAESKQEARDRSAAIWLLDHFVRERAGHFRAALSRWHEWETNGFQRRIAYIINDKPPTAELTPADAVPANDAV